MSRDTNQNLYAEEIINESPFFYDENGRLRVRILEALYDDEEKKLRAEFDEKDKDNAYTTQVYLNPADDPREKKYQEFKKERMQNKGDSAAPPSPIEPSGGGKEKAGPRPNLDFWRRQNDPDFKPPVVRPLPRDGGRNEVIEPISVTPKPDKNTDIIRGVPKPDENTDTIGGAPEKLPSLRPLIPNRDGPRLPTGKLPEPSERDEPTLGTMPVRERPTPPVRRPLPVRPPGRRPPGGGFRPPGRRPRPIGGDRRIGGRVGGGSNINARPVRPDQNMRAMAESTILSINGEPV